VPGAFSGPETFRSNVLFAPYYRETKPVVVYESGFVTRLGDPNVRLDLPLEAGQDDKTLTIFYVPKGAFDRLRVYMIGIYGRSDQQTIPTRIITDKNGLPAFKGPNSDIHGIHTFSKSLTALDLNGR
jgi:hypothetical protein